MNTMIVHFLRNKYYNIYLSCVVFIFLSLIVVSAQANPEVSAHTEVALLSEQSSLKPGDVIELAVRFRLDPGWHIYWKNPGDSGLPPKVDWILPDHFSISEPKWPYPHRLDDAGLTTYGYNDEVVLLYELKVPQNISSSPISIKAELKWLACEVICVPGQAELSLLFPVSNKSFVISKEKLENIHKNLPVTITATDVDVQVYQSNSAFIVFVTTQRVVDGLEFFSSQAEIVNHAEVQQFLEINGGYSLTINKSELLEEDVNRLSGVLYNSDNWDAYGHKALSFDVVVEPIENFQQLNSFVPQEISLALAALFAFLGGLILNLMPCVLPVLSIKVLNLVQQAGEDKRKVLVHGLTFSLGILVSFWCLAGLLIFLRFSGVQVGWGFQFQSPGFLILMSYLFFGLGLNLFGVFEIGTVLTRIKASPQDQGGLRGSFFNGVLATIVATPCTAPFMGSALGFAIGQPVNVAFIVFTFLGVGMAFPYLLLSVFPQWLRFVPKPGNWMLKLKQFFGFLMVATSVWLLWVLGVQRGVEAMAAVVLGFIGLGLTGWIIGGWASPLAKPYTKLFAWIISGIIFICVLVIPIQIAYHQSEMIGHREQSSQGYYWEPYSQEIITDSLKNGKIVFVDFTASWCLTCQVNKKVSLQHPDVEQAFKEKGVVAVRADWTNHDERISWALEALGKTSIPVYVLYNPRNPRGPVFLPEILTSKIVIEYLDKISE